MTWWTWALIVWAVTASVAVLWLVARLSAQVEQLAGGSAERDDLWGIHLPEDQPLAEPHTLGRWKETSTRLAAELRRHLAADVHR